MTLIDQGTFAPEREHGPRHDVLTGTTLLAALLAVVGWLPFLRVPASPDEGGFLLVASQWRPGDSLYGNYWVDRPPLLFLIHQVAVALGGTPALRIVGVAAVACSVFLAAALCRSATATARTRPATAALVAPVVIAASFLTSPLFGTTEVDGELLAVPCVLAGLLAYTRASAANTRAAAIRWALAAGAAATSSAMVKQNAVDVFVFAAAVVIVRILAGDRRRALRVAGVFACGAAAALAGLLGVAMLHGTSPGGLWDSVVTFRFQAASVIHSSATSATSQRFHHLLLAAVASVAPAVLGVLLWRARLQPAPVRGGRRSAPDLKWPAVAVLVWEVASIVGGGSFWLHYLLDLVPGLVLLAVAVAQRPAAGRRLTGGVLAAAALSAAIATVGAAQIAPDSSDAGAISYLRTHARPDDTATVAFGHPNILWEAHLGSPYPQLWSLPVRVRDHDLTELSQVLVSRRAPTWVVVAGNSLSSWGIDAAHGDAVLAAHYHRVAAAGRYTIWHVSRTDGR